MTDRIYIDLETRNPVLDLKKCGLHVYASHPETDLWCMAYAFDDEEPALWTPGQILPDRIRYHIAQSLKIWAHNAPFELALWNKVGVLKYGFPIIGVKDVVCTASMAYAMALPGSLSGACLATGVDQLKDNDGKSVMLRLCKLADPKQADPKDVAALGEYCKQDLRALRALAKRLLPLSASERLVWELDQKINERGIKIDVASVKLAYDVVTKETQRLDAEMQQITEGEVPECTKVLRLKSWIQKRTGRVLDGIDKSAVVELISDTSLPDDVGRALVLRQEAGKSSTAKLLAMLNCVGEGQRIRGALQYHAAHTGRWGGRLFQPHNLPRMKKEVWEVSAILDLLRMEDAAEAIHLFHGPPLQVISDILRSFIISEDEGELFYGDYNAIEARVLAWLAGESHVLNTFEEGQDPYIAAYVRSFGGTASGVTKQQRQIGKVQVLALGYQGSVGAYQAMGKNYGVNLPGEEIQRIVDRWRESHPNIVNFWWNLERKALAAVKEPGKSFRANGSIPGNGVDFKMSGSFLFCRLPSGRLLTYPYPALKTNTIKSRQGREFEKEGLVYKDVENNFTDVSLYGGKLAENITQAVARDIMVNGMMNLESNRYPVLFHVHDELLGQLKRKASSEDLANITKLMCQLPEWAKRLPIKAEVHAGKRYLK